MRLLLRLWLLLLLAGTACPALARAGGGGGHGSGGGHSGGGGHGSEGGGHSFGEGYHGGGYSGSGGNWGGYSGSGGSHGSGSAVEVLVLLGILGLLAWAACREPRAASPTQAKRRAAQALLARLATHDARWQPALLQARVAEVFYQVQAAWTANDQDLARDCLSTRLYHKHKAQTDKFLALGRRNVLADIKLHEAVVYSVSDHKRDDLDSFWVQVRGSMLDYQVNQAGTVLAGSATVPESFTEAWKFKWAAGRWVLDRIASPAPGLLAGGGAYSHKLRRAPAKSGKRRRPVR